MGPIFISVHRDYEIGVSHIVRISPSGDGSQILLRDNREVFCSSPPVGIRALIDAERIRVATIEARATAEGYLGEQPEDPACEERQARLGTGWQARNGVGHVWFGPDGPLYLPQPLESLADALVGQLSGRLATAEMLASAVGIGLMRRFDPAEVPKLMAQLAERIGPFAEETPDGWKIPTLRQGNGNV